MFRLNQELSLISQQQKQASRNSVTTIKGLNNSNQTEVAYNICCTNLKFIQNDSFIMFHPFKVHYSLNETMWYKCVKLILPKKLFFLVSFLPRPLSIKPISQSSIPKCLSNIKWVWNETWMTEWPLQNLSDKK